jgi:hypothetical protein
MNARDERILKDLAANLRDKILHNVSDYYELCHCAGLNDKAIAAEAMCFLIKLTASFAAHRFNISPADFSEAMGIQFQHAQSHLEDDE